MTHQLAKRALVAGIRAACQQQGIQLTVLSDGWVFRLQKNTRTHLVYGYGFDYNTQAAAELATDKAATYELLTKHGVLAVPHYLLSNLAQPLVTPERIKQLFHDGRDWVVKPNLGAHGRNIARFSNAEAALSFSRTRPEEVWAASPYIDITREIRLVVLDGVVEVAYEKYAPITQHRLSMFNASLGVKTRRLANPLDRQFVQLAVKSVEALNLRLAAVDLITNGRNDTFILELNVNFALEAYARTSAADRQIVIDFYRRLTTRLFQ